MTVDKLALLKSVPILTGIDEPILSELAKQLKETNYDAKCVIFSEGTYGDAFYIVDQGEVVISKELGPKNEKTLAVMGPDGVFGEMAFFSDSPRTAKAAARTDSVLLRLDRSDFRNFVEKAPQAGVKILSALLRVSMDRLEQTSRELATIYKTGKLLSSGDELPVIARAVMEEIQLAIPDALKCAFYIYNEYNQDYDPLVAPEGSPQIPEFQTDLRKIKNGSEDFPNLDVFKAAKSLLTAPILMNEKMLGFLAVWNTEQHGVFRNSHRLLLFSVAGQLAEAIENVKHRQEERDKERLNNSKLNY